MKKLNIPQNLRFGIDTIEIVIDVNAESRLFKKTYEFSDNRAKVKVNPDKAYDNRCIVSYTEYKDSVLKALQQEEIDTPILRRIDFRWDNMKDGYTTFYKINKALILCLDLYYKNDNRYESIDPLTLKEKSIRCENRNIEAEYYNKKLQEPDSLIQSRLELRAKRGKYYVGMEPQYFAVFAERLNKAVCKKQLARLCNLTFKALADRWVAEKDICSPCSFLYKYRNAIYTKEMVIELCKYLGYKSPDQQIYSGKFDLITLDELIVYKEKLIETGKEYFEM